MNFNFLGDLSKIGSSVTDRLGSLGNTFGIGGKHATPVVSGPLSGMSKADIAKRAVGIKGLPQIGEGASTLAKVGKYAKFGAGTAGGVAAVGLPLWHDANTLLDHDKTGLQKTHAGLNAALTVASAARFGPLAGGPLAQVGDWGMTQLGNVLGSHSGAVHDINKNHDDFQKSLDASQKKLRDAGFTQDKDGAWHKPAGYVAAGSDSGGGSSDWDTPVVKQPTLDDQLTALGLKGEAGGLDTLAAAQQSMNAQYDQLMKDLKQRYASLDSPTSGEKAIRDYNLADLEAEKRAGLAAVNNAFDLGRHNNYLTEQRTRSDATAAGTANAKVYNDAAARIAADAKSFGGQMAGGQGVAGAAQDAAINARSEAATQGALATNLGNITADELATLGAGMEQQRDAQAGDTARAAAAARAGFMNTWSNQVNSRQTAERAALADAQNKADAGRISDNLGLGTTYAGYENKNQADYLSTLRGIATDAGKDQFAQTVQSLLNGGGAGGTDWQSTPYGQAVSGLHGNVQSATDVNGMTVTDGVTVNSDRVRQAVSTIMAKAPTNPQAFASYYAQSLMDLRSTVDPQAYYAMEQAGLTDPARAWQLLHGGA